MEFPFQSKVVFEKRKNADCGIDLFEVKGWVTRYGSSTSSTEPDDFDAPVVARLKEQGAILLGKVTT